MTAAVTGVATAAEIESRPSAAKAPALTRATSPRERDPKTLQANQEDHNDVAAGGAEAP